MKLFGGSLAVTAFIALAGAGTAGAASGMADMMAEGIPYECAEVQKCIDVPNDNRADTGALMAEGIVYADSVVADDEVLIRLDHRQLLLHGMGACICEGLPALVAGR